MSDPDDTHPIAPDAVSAAADDHEVEIHHAELDDDPEGGLDLGALLGGGEGGFDFGALLQQASDMQQQMAEAQERIAEQVVEGVAGGGVVRIIVAGDMEFQAVTIDPSAVDPDDVEMLQDLVLAALHDAVANVQRLQAEAMGGFGIGDVDLGGLLSDEAE